MKKVVKSGVLHFHDAEVVQTDTHPNFWFKRGEGTHSEAIKAVPRDNGIEVQVFLEETSQYGGILTIGGTVNNQLYCDIERVSEIRGGPFYRVNYSLKEG